MSYTNVWNNSLPTGSEAANTIDDIFRGSKVDISERLIDIFAMPNFTADPLRPYGLKFADAQDAVISLGDNSGTPRSLIVKDKANSDTYLTINSTGITPKVSIMSQVSSGVILSNTGNATTGNLYGSFANTSAALVLGIESSVGGTLFSGSTAYSSVFGSSTNEAVHLATNGIVRLTIASGGDISITGRLLAETVASSAPSVGVFGSGTYNTANDAAASATKGLLSYYINSATGTTVFGMHSQLVQSAAAGTTSAYAFHSQFIATHTSGTLTTAIGLAGAANIVGVGGTTTTVWSIMAQSQVAASVTVGTLIGVEIRTGLGISGTVSTAIGVNIESITAANSGAVMSNIAIKSAGGVWVYGSVPTSSAGLTTGAIYSNAGVLTIV